MIEHALVKYWNPWLIVVCVKLQTVNNFGSYNVVTAGKLVSYFKGLTTDKHAKTFGAFCSG